MQARLAARAASEMRVSVNQRAHVPVRYLRQIYRYLPASAREALAPLAANIVPHLYRRRGKSSPLPGVTVAGLFSSACGLGEGARLQANALAALGIPVERLDLSPLLDRAPSLAPPSPDALMSGGPLIVHMNPPVFSRALRLIGRRRLRDRKLIAYWAWELERVPETWRDSATGVDAIWAPSQFSADAIGTVLGRAVTVVPHPVTASLATPDRAAFGLPDGAFVALTFVDLNSNMSRKNPFGVIEAFARAAANPAMPPSCLVIKLAGGAEHPAQAARLRAAIASCPARIMVLEQSLPRAERDCLMASVDVLLSLHRSEGFGLTLAEAIASGKPTIGTGWSGNLEFMTAENATLVPAALVPVQDDRGFYDASLRWAEPDLDAAAAALVRTALAPAGRRGVGLDLVARFANTVLAHTEIAALARVDAA